MEIKIEDLLEQCKRCNGTGWVDEKFPMGGGGSYGTKRQSFSGTCPECNGTRGKLTESGEAIAELFRFLQRRG